MGWAIGSAVFFFASGLGILIWSLGERRKRYEAEKATLKAQQQRDKAAAKLELLAKQVEKSNEDTHRVNLLAESRLKTINELRKRLVDASDPEAVLDWLDDELGSQI